MWQSSTITKGSLLYTYHPDVSSHVSLLLHSHGNDNNHTFETSLEQVYINSELHSNNHDLDKELQNVPGIHNVTVVHHWNRCRFTMWHKFGSMIGSFADKVKTMETKCLCSNERIQIFHPAQDLDRMLYGRFNEWWHFNERRLRPRLWCTRIFATRMAVDLGLVRTCFVCYRRVLVHCCVYNHTFRESSN